MALGVTTLLVASSLIAGQASPAVSTETTFMNQTIDENKTYTEEDFPVDYIPKACDGACWHLCHEDRLRDYYWCQEDLRPDPSDTWNSHNAIPLIYKDEFLQQQTYHAQVPYGVSWINYDSYYGSDFKWYSFALFENTKVTLDVTASSDSIECTIYKLSYFLDDEGNNKREYNPIYEHEAFNSDSVVFSDELDAGSYIFSLSQKLPDGYSSPDVYGPIVDYSLDLFLEKTENKSYFSIADLRYNKNLSGAIWSSNYRPCGIDEVTSDKQKLEYKTKIGSDIKYTTGCLTTDLHRDYAMDFIQDKADDNIIPFDIIYLWDNDLIGRVYNFLASYAQKLQESYYSREGLNNVFSKAYDYVHYYLTFKVSLGSSFFSGDPLAGFAFSELLGQVVSALLLPFDSSSDGSVLAQYGCSDADLETLQKYCLYIEHLVTSAGWASKKETGVLQLPIPYRIHDQRDFMATGDSKHIFRGESVFENYTKASFGWETYYDSKYLSTQPNAAYGLSGTLRGLQLKESVEENANGTKETTYKSFIYDINYFADEYKPVDNIQSSSSELTESSSSSDNADYGDYRWFSYTANKSAPHAIIATSNEPILLEIFNKQTLGYSNDGRLGMATAESTNKNDCEYDSVNKRFVACFDMYLKKNQTIYFRIQGHYCGVKYGYSKLNFAINTVAYENADGEPLTMRTANIPNIMAHKHQHLYGYRVEYNKIGQFNTGTSDGHYAYCWKDDAYITEKHTLVLRRDIKTRTYKFVCSKCGYSK